ncbi:GGDEF domain-containing protein [Microvirga sp. VF16]|uniref:GGDEF domain-containing protein n=1 Tax=Microvirga sp. VF16 TaxID=2807101 RepID=UPI001FEEA1B6|nr:GGDEF domain-containing protein [Microvirga sp. VF16]
MPALKASQTDQLTGLPNCRQILGLLDEALAANEDTGSGLCVAVIDIDHFKAINDAHGHEAGDAVLEHFARSCREKVRAQDDLGRTGGEEFLLLIFPRLRGHRVSSFSARPVRV